MSTTRRSLMWPLLMVAIGVIWLLIVAGVLPEAVRDVLQRAWPALAVLFGFDVLVGRRSLRLGGWALDMSYAGLALTLGLVLAVVFLAYRQQAEVVRSDQVHTFSKVLPEAVQRVSLRVEMERTAVVVRPAAEYPRELALVFSGSAESDVAIVWDLSGEAGTLAVRETYRHAIPRLEDIGRGTLEITLPVGVVLETVELAIANGAVTLDLTPITAQAFVAEVGQGDVVLRLPTQDVLDADLTVRDGRLELLVPAGAMLNVRARGSVPEFQFDRDRYDLLVGGELKSRSAESFQYTVDVRMKGGAPLVITDVR